MTIGELMRGARKIKEEPRRNTYEHWIENDLSDQFEGRILAFDDKAARTWGRLMEMVTEKVSHRLPPTHRLQRLPSSMDLSWSRGTSKTSKTSTWKSPIPGTDKGMSNVLPPLEDLDLPTKWPAANARLLGLGAGLPVQPLDRLANFSADEFERFALEWADGYLRTKLSNVTDVQQRGGAGDKGRDIIVWFGEPGSPSRHWHLYQCKRYATALGAGKGIAEIAKVLFYAHRGDYTLPSEYWFVTRKGVGSGYAQKVVVACAIPCTAGLLSDKTNIGDC